ncbi:hypothetical protein ASPVEDRAFT_41903 [Aspergillus versicolor CBS 583.65]|uniref:Uncharacterized protein n=1 Tax=Aspergillus versicolor CBS 583.65 TaxID=1036611 RepID=A0A1L9PLR6_ASPVE|nr:uncharacterized protein ASPVEDRAFT_41903 [Aspergillus versicolor CBS 583.65]OJJ02412.1 hypothetical protein ASPVEDRAFT_41903 [Aspergillus versicolor CBS 583.65]
MGQAACCSKAMAQVLRMALFLLMSFSLCRDGRGRCHGLLCIVASAYPVFSILSVSV